MITAALASLTVGAMLGARFKVAILLPVILLAMAGILFSGIVSEQKASSIVALQFIAFVCLQVSYFSSAVVASYLTQRPLHPGGMTVRDSR